MICVYSVIYEILGDVFCDCVKPWNLLFSCKLFCVEFVQCKEKKCMCFGTFCICFSNEQSIEKELET